MAQPDPAPAPSSLRRIRPDEVRIGMYVHAFEGHWLSHPFWRRHFLVENEAMLRRLRGSAVAAVVVDDARSTIRGAPAARVRVTPAPPAPAPLRPRHSLVAARGEELDSARRLVERSRDDVRQAFESVRQGEGISLPRMIAVVDDISSAMTRSLSMLLGLTRLKTKDEYTYQHSVSVCALLINFGRELGMDDQTVRDLGMGGLLHDIGKTLVSDAILNKPGRLSAEEYAEIRRHAGHGHTILRMDGGVPAVALDICLHHHEKLNGTGYPEGLAGDAISTAARMAAICDVYDALTSVRPYKKAMVPADALALMRSWSGHFDPALLFRFMCSIRIFPVGIAVRLRSGRIATVLPSGLRSSRPRLLVFHCGETDRPVAPYELVLLENDASDAVVEEVDPARYGMPDMAAAG